MSQVNDTELFALAIQKFSAPLISKQFLCFFSQNGLHATHIHLIYEHKNEDVILDLHLNDNLIPLEHFVSYQQPNGDKAIKNFTKTEIDLCNYQVSRELRNGF